MTSVVAPQRCAVALEGGISQVGRRGTRSIRSGRRGVGGRRSHGHGRGAIVPMAGRDDYGIGDLGLGDFGRKASNAVEAAVTQ